MSTKGVRLRGLQVLAEKYQIILGLVEWNVNVLWASKKECDEYLGLNYWHTEENLCTIKVARSDRRKEQTVVHELIHLALEGHKEPHPYDPMYERGINRIADAIVALNNPEVKE